MFSNIFASLFFIVLAMTHIPLTMLGGKDKQFFGAVIFHIVLNSIATYFIWFH